MLPRIALMLTGLVTNLDANSGLIAAPGRLGDYYWLQWKYMDFQGHVNQLESLACVAELEWDLMLPGHGAPLARAEVCIDELSDRLAQLHGIMSRAHRLRPTHTALSTI